MFVVIPYVFSKFKKWKGQSQLAQSGQVVVEYVLLLVVGVSIAILITTLMVNRSPDNPGFLVKKWRQIVETIAQDKTEDLGN